MCVPITSAFSRFKVTPVIEDNAVAVSSIPSSSISQNIVTAEQSQAQTCVKKQGRFQITRVADEVPLIAAAQPSTDELKKKDQPVPQIPVDSSVSILVEKSPNLQNTVPAHVTQNILLQHSCSNPSLVSSVPDKVALCSQIPASALTRSVSDVAFVNGQPAQNIGGIDASALNSNIQKERDGIPVHFSQDKEQQLIEQPTTSNVNYRADLPKPNIPSNVFQSSDTIASELIGRNLKTIKPDDIKHQYLTNNIESAQNYSIPSTAAIPYSASNLRDSSSQGTVYANVPYSHDSSNFALPQSVQGLPSGNATYGNLEIKFSQSHLPYPVLKTSESPKMLSIPTAYSVPPSESGLAFPPAPSAAVHPVLPCPPDSVIKASDVHPFYPHSDQPIQMQQPLMKDANANTLHLGYNTEDVKSVQVRV